MHGLGDMEQNLKQVENFAVFRVQKFFHNFLRVANLDIHSPNWSKQHTKKLEIHHVLRIWRFFVSILTDHGLKIKLKVEFSKCC